MMGRDESRYWVAIEMVWRWRPDPLPEPTTNFVTYTNNKEEPKRTVRSENRTMNTTYPFQASGLQYLHAPTHVTRHDLQHPIICITSLTVVVNENIRRFERAVSYSLLGVINDRRWGGQRRNDD